MAHPYGRQAGSPDSRKEETSVNRSRIRRFLGLTAAAALTLAALGAGAVTAKTPDWVITFDRLPATVAPGNDAGYAVTVKNNGTSTINRARFSATPATTPTATPSYFSGLSWVQGGPEVGCTSTGTLVCDLGTMDAGEEFNFVVAYAVPASASGKFDVTFFMEAGTGNVGGKNNSRGDKLEVTASTNLNGTQNFDGGFTVDDFSYATGGNLGRNNKQTSQADVTDELITVMVQDGITDNLCDEDDDAACADLIGEWTRLTVPGNDGYIKLTLNIWGGSVPGGTQPGDIFLVHVLDDGTTVEIIGDDPSEICADANTAPASGECIKVTKVGNNYKIVAWLEENGSLRGGI
jgi:hypothetical protein